MFILKVLAIIVVIIVSIFALYFIVVNAFSAWATLKHVNEILEWYDEENLDWKSWTTNRIISGYFTRLEWARLIEKFKHDLNLFFIYFKK